MTLDALEFIRRFLEHSLPSGFMKVRYYGVLHGCSRVPLEKIRASIEMVQGFDVLEPVKQEEEREKGAPVCTDCGRKLVYRYPVPPYRMPPWRSPG